MKTHLHFFCTSLLLLVVNEVAAQCAPASVPTNTPCYTTVINDDPYCCNVMWDGICQSAYDACVASGGNNGGGGGGTGCNTNTSICSNSAAAGPFFFAPASANPSSCLDFFNGQTAPNYAYIILYITTSGNLNLLIDANTTGFLDVSIFDITGAADPCSSLSVATEIGCNYASATDGCAEFGSNFAGCISEVPAPAVTAGDVLMILVEDWSDTQTSFTLSLSNAPGSAQTGPPDATVTSTGTYCSTDGPFQLSAVNNGGTWSGPGTSATGTFNPATAGLGTHTINYTIGQAPCDDQGQTTITVVDCSVPCSFTYPQNAYCQSAADPTPTVTGAGAAGGTFSSTGGLVINPTTGVIDLSASTPGTYNVNYTPPGSALCTGITPFQITVNPLPTVNASNNVAICAGGTTPLTVTGASTYTWSPATGLSATSGANVNASPASTTTYTVTGTNANGCVNTDVVTVTVNPIPTVNAGVDQTICLGQSVTLTGSGSGGVTYTWNNGVSNGVAFTPATTGTTTYTVTGTGAGGCTATDQVQVVVNATPTVVANDVSVCSGQSVAVTASGAATYSWSPATGLSATTGATVNASPSTTTTYTVTGTNAAGCTSTDNVTVTVTPNAPINAGPDVTICTGSSTTITATGGVSYTWNSGLGSGASHTVSPASTTTYTVTGTDAGGCVGTDQVVVTITPNPTVNAGADQTVCAGTSVTLNGAGATSYTWNNGVTNGVAFTPASTATYTVTGTSNGCSSTDQVLITVNPVPTVNAGPDQTVCAGTSVTLTASGATSYAWNNGVNNGVSFVPAATTTYTVTGTSSGCSATDQVVVTVNPIPNVNAGSDQVLCEGSVVTLTASGANSYSWTNGVSNGVGFTQAVGQQTYTVTGTTTAGCVDTDQVSVTVNANPTPVITGPTDYCAGSSSTLSTTIPYTNYSWSTGSNAATISATDADNPITVTVTNAGGCTGTSAVFSVQENNMFVSNTTITICQGDAALIHGNSQTVAGTYSQTYTTSSGCDSVSNVTLVVNSLPAINAGIDQSVCENSSVTLTASGANFYAWDNGVTNGNAFTPSVGSITYTVTGTDLNGCTATDQVIVTVNPFPSINAGPDQSVCVGASVTLSGTGGNSYMWSNGVMDGQPFNPVATATYQVTGTDVNGCQNTDQVVVTVNQGVVVNAGMDVEVCAGNTVTLTGSGATTYAWTGGVLNNTPFTQAPGTIVYTVTGTDANGCTDTDDVSVTVYALPTVNAGADQTVCFGEMVTLTASGASTYFWSPSATNGQAFTPVAGTTNYTVTGTDANGCQNSDVVTITANALPVVAAGADQTICEGESTVLTAQGAGSGANYVWTANVANGQQFVPLATATYTVTATDANGCQDTDDVTITVNPNPVINAGNDLSGCDGDQFVLTGSGAGAGGIYVWTNNVSNGVPFIAPYGTTTYTVTGTDAYGCSSTDDVQIVVQTAPNLSFDFDQIGNCVPVTVTFTNTTADLVENCLWSLDNGAQITGCGPFTHTFTEPGSYGVALQAQTVNNGCVASIYYQDIIIVDPLPVAAFTVLNDEITTLNTEVAFTNTSVNANSYIWNFGDAQSTTSNQVNPVFTYDPDPGIYTVELIAISHNGCADTTYTVIRIEEELIFYVPNTFTPDFDQFNQDFRPIFTAGFDPYDYTLMIYNRWGEAVFESHNAEVGWSGTYGAGGEACQDGTYTWVIEFKTTQSDERKRETGLVNLLR